MAALKIIFQAHRGTVRFIKDMTDKELEEFRTKISNASKKDKK